MLFSYFYAVFYLMRVGGGMSFREAAAFILDALLWPFSRTFLSVVPGGIIGFMGYWVRQPLFTAGIC